MTPEEVIPTAPGDRSRGPLPWIDVSVPLRDGLVCWPGDPPVRIGRTTVSKKGRQTTVSELSMSAHTGTHMDAPLHYLAGGTGIDEFPLDLASGRARVLEIDGSGPILSKDLRRHRIRRDEKILLKTRNSTRDWPSHPFLTDYVGLAPEAARFLAARGIRLIGVDYLSVGGSGEDGDETHAALLDAGIWIVEGLDLSRVAPGRYEILCLPLRIEHGDGAPARVLLRPARLG